MLGSQAIITVQDLIDRLSQFDPKTSVVIGGDPRLGQRETLISINSSRDEYGREIIVLT